MSYPSIHGPAATCARPSPVPRADAVPRPGPVERQLLASLARDARGQSFEALYADFPHDIGRDALRDAALDCLRLKWLAGTFACLRCTDAGRLLLQAHDAGEGENGACRRDEASAGLDGSEASWGASAVAEDVPGEASSSGAGDSGSSRSRQMRWAPRLHTVRTYDAEAAPASFPAEADHEQAAPAGQGSPADAYPDLRAAPRDEPRPRLIEAKSGQPDAHLRVRKKLGRLACIDFGDPPLGGTGKRSATTVARRLLLGLKCLLLPSYRDARAVSRHMGELLGALTRPVDLLPIAAPVRGWPPLSRAHLHFIASDETALRTEARAVRVAGVPPEERYKPTPISLCIPPLTRHISRLGEADRKALLHGLDQELSRLMQYAGNALPPEPAAAALGVADGDDGGEASSPHKIIGPGEPLRYRMLLTMVKFLVEDAQQPLR
ncbi:hypothetical protein BOSP111201_02130 [Bordetella sputigena]|uniref:hypothetical protein n=1 Tax=Bordetella sputigena TaxID=1416810 RepID=UPI0039EF3CD9